MSNNIRKTNNGHVNSGKKENNPASYIKENIPITDVLSKLGGLELTKQGKEWVGNCPSGHSSKSEKCFHVIYDQAKSKNFYICHSCGISGSPVDLVMLAEDCNYPDAMLWFKNNYKELERFPSKQSSSYQENNHAESDLRLQTMLYESLIKEGKELLFGPEGSKVLKYLTESRGYSEENIKKTELFYLPEDSVSREIIRNALPDLGSKTRELKLVGHYGDNFRLAFPYRDRNGLITGLVKRADLQEGISGRTCKGEDFVKQRFDSTPGLSKDDLFGLNRIRKTETVLIVEGYFDAMYLYALGQTNIVAVGQGELSNKHLEGLHRKGIKKVIIAFDNDEVGPNNTERAVKLLMRQSDITPFVLDPKKMGKPKDPDEYVKSLGFEAFTKLLKEVEKGSLWVTKRILEKAKDGGDLEKDAAYSESMELCCMSQSLSEQDEIVSLICQSLNKKKPIVNADLKKRAKALASDSKSQQVQVDGTFWTVSGSEAEIDLHKYVQFLIEDGFSKYYLDKDYVFVKVTNNLVSEKSLPQIKDYILDYLKTLEADEETKEVLFEHVYDNVNKYFNEGLIECIPPKQIKFKKDTEETASVYYKNGFVLLSKGHEPDLMSYDELDAPVWEHTIIDRNIKLLYTTGQVSEFEQFLRNVTGGSEERFHALCTAIGYLLHDYKPASSTKAIILCDQKISDNPNGRTGKSLVGKAIQKVKNVVRIDGKNFEFNDRFTFQMVKLGTQILDFNDVNVNFDFESLFHAITDGMSVEYKNKTPFEIPFEESPKFLISTNYTIKGEGSSFSDRMYEFEFSDYYNAEHKPKDDFGHDFFTGWDEDEWNRFDNFMLSCLQMYLEEGLVSCELINLSMRKLIDQTSAQFVEFAEEKIKADFEYNLNALYTEFKEYIGFENDMFDKCPIKQNTFTKWLPDYAKYKGLDYSKRSSNSVQKVKFAA